MPATLKDRVAELRNDAQAIVDTADGEGRGITEAEQAQFNARLEMISMLEQLGAQSDAAVAEHNDLAVAPAAQRDPGLVFAESDAIKRLQEQYPNGIPRGTRVETGAVSVGSIRNDLLSDPGISPHRQVIDAPTGVAVMDLMQAITVLDGVMERSVDHFTAAFTNAAAAVAESVEGTPVTKPEAALAWTPTTLTQEAIPQHMPVTNQALKFNRMLRGIVNGFLVNGVMAAAQSRVATQLAAWSGLGVQAFDTDLRTTLRRAVTKAQNAAAIIGAGTPSILISTTDAETLDLEQLANLVLAPGQAPNQVGNIWRTNLVVSANIPTGTAYVGDLKQVIWYTTGDVELSIGLVGNQFIENSQTLLAETYGVTGVLGAPALIKTALA